MNIKELIKALLQSKFGGVQLSQSRIDAIASRLEGKVKDEAELLQKLEVLNELQPFTETCAEDDRTRSVQAELDKLKKPVPTPQPTLPVPVPSPTPTEDVPAWAKAIIDGQKVMSETVAGLKSEKVVTDRRSTILSKLEGADKSYSDSVLGNFDFMSFPDDETFNKYIAKVETDFANHTQTTAESKLGNDAPFVGVGKDGKVTEASKEELDSVMSEIGLQ